MVHKYEIKEFLKTKCMAKIPPWEANSGPDNPKFQFRLWNTYLDVFKNIT